MKIIPLLLALMFSMTTFTIDAAQPQTKKVCKTFSKKTKCRTVKIHKKFIGTQVPKRVKK